MPSTPKPDLASIHRELSRPGVTLQLLWVEYRDVHPDGYGYSRFCELYQRFRNKPHPTMRQVHPAGKKTFVDYSGKKSTIVDPTTGEIEDVELFVCYRTPKPGHCGTPEKRPLRVAVQPSIHPRPKEGDAHGELPEDEEETTSYRFARSRLDVAPDRG